MKNNLAIIPARSGSKRIKNKNIKKFNNKPIIKYTLDTLKNTNLFSKIHVSSDSNEIIKICDKYLREKSDFKRPKNISLDSTPIFDVLKFVFNKYKKLGFDFENILLMTPCSPLINQKDIKNCFEILKNNKNNNPVISVSSMPAPIEYSYKINNNGILKPIFQKKISVNSNKLQESYYDTGNIILFNKKHLLNNKNTKKFYKIFLPYIIPKYRAVDIDNIKDWKYAELLHRIIKN